MASRGFLLVDANVLVDYQSADLTILALVSRHVGTVHIVSTVLAEVKGLDESICQQLGLIVVEPSIEQANEAAPPNGRLSLADRLCCVVSRDNHWTCVSNDKALRRECASAGVPVIWSLELLLELVKSGHLPSEDAWQAAVRMQRVNPMFLGQSILTAFREKLAKVGP